MRNKVLPLIIALTLVTSLVVAGCAAPAPAPAPTPASAPAPSPPPAPAPTPPAETQYVTIGISTPLTGWAAAWGIEHLRAAEILFAQVNKAGGLDVGGEPHLIKWIVYDDKFDPTEAQIIANRLIHEDKVDIFALEDGPPATAARDVSRDAGMLQYATDYTIDQPSAEYPLVFGTMIKTPEIVVTVHKWMEAVHPEIKTMAVLTVNLPYGIDQANLTESHGPEYGINITSVDFFEPWGTIDFTAILLKIMDDNPDAINMVGTGPDVAAIIVKQARELGYDGLLMHTTGPNLEVMKDIAGAEAMEGFIGGFEYGEPFIDAVQIFKNDYLVQYKPPFVPQAILHYASWQALLQGIELAGSFESEALANALRSGTFNTVLGNLHFGGEEWYGIDNQLLYPVSLATVHDGKIMHLAAPDPVYPTK